MNKVFGMTFTEIADLEGVKNTAVSAKVRRAFNMVITGRYQLFKPTPEQIQRAEREIDGHNKAMKRYARRRAAA